MIITLKNYQENKVEELVKKSRELLDREGADKRIVFQSATGSGKTIMVAEYLKRLVAEVNKPYAFIWVAPRGLHLQSRAKLEEYYDNKDDRTIECKEWTDLDDKQIDQDEVLFLNWESLNRTDKNTIIRDNEREFYLDKVISNTKDEGREIILIIDEIHYSADTKTAHDIINIISPKLTLEVSATPVIAGNELVRVDLEDVKNEVMIKKSVILNPNFAEKIKDYAVALKNNTLEIGNTDNDFILDEAMKKRVELVKAYQQENTDINPLLLVQLPDRKSQQDDRLMEWVVQTLKDRYHITQENGKLAIYLSENKANLENIAMNNNQVEVMIFKQGIALGWDCPRASILVLFRDIKSAIFSIQTIGRIMRMPEPNKGEWYQDEVLNNAYVFTNLPNIEIEADIGTTGIMIFTSHRLPTLLKGYQSTLTHITTEELNDGETPQENQQAVNNEPQIYYTPLKLKSYYRSRQREKYRLSPAFTKYFQQSAKNNNLKNQIDLQATEVENLIISDEKRENVDEMANTKITATTQLDVISERQLQQHYDGFLLDTLGGISSSADNNSRAIGIVKRAIEDFFLTNFMMNYKGEESATIMRLILNEKNNKFFDNVIDEAITNYLNDLEKQADKIEVNENWEVPTTSNYTSQSVVLPVKKSILQPFYFDNKWETEKAFIEYLEKNDKVEWWYKNGERDTIYFAVPYIENNRQQLFYVDFVVRFTDGKIGLFDTKNGQTITTAKDKSDGLQTYLKDESDKNLIGGIVAQSNNRWMIYLGEGKDLVAGNFVNWGTLENML